MAEAKTPAKYEPPKELEQKAAVQKFAGRPKRQPVDQAEYFYNVKTMHIVMFASSLALLLGYLLMFRKDHERPWKEYQDEFAKMDFEKLWYDLSKHRFDGREAEKRVADLNARIDAFLEAYAQKGELPITVFDPAAASKSPNLSKPEFANVRVLVDKEKKKLGVAEIEKIRGPREDSQQDFNFRKDEAGAFRFQFESAKHHLEEAEKTGDERRAAFERHFADAKRKYEAKLKEVDEKKKIADAYFFQNAFYEDLAGDLQKRPVPGVWDFIERLTKEEVDAFAALAKDAKFSEPARQVFGRLAAAYAKSDVLKGMSENVNNKDEEKRLLAKLAAGQAPTTADELRVFHRLTMVTDQRFNKAERDVLSPLGKPGLSRAERDAVTAELGKSGERKKLLERLLNLSLEDIRKEIGELRKEIADREARFEQERPNFANLVRNKPGLDFIKPTIKVQQVVLDNIKDQLNFAAVSKVDRCQTCHVGIDKPLYEVWIDPTKENDLEKYVFRDEFLRNFVAHALGKSEAKDCEVCGKTGTFTDRKDTEMPAPRTAHGAWDSDDAIRFTKTFMAHPRLRDLYVGDNSKHPMLKFGCTICHEGDGRDTHFSRVVHMPDTPKEAVDWKRRHGTPYGLEHYDWNYRELWDLPMIQTKFLQSSCRRCHKESVELDGADKYTQGMKLFERAGCYGCHRTETYQILPKDTKNPHLDPNWKARRPGPPLTRISTKVDETWAAKWVLAPREFRPTTRMPHFFGQSNTRTTVNGNSYPIYTDKQGKRRSPVEDAIAASMVKYIWSLSDTKPDPEPPANLKGDAHRGGLIVAQVGCMACHKTVDTPESEFTKWAGRSRYLDEFGPSLAGVGSKIKSKGWLYAWVRDPKKHFQDSSMPSLRLSEQEAVDVVEYLMTLKNPEFDKDPGPPAADAKAVEDLIFELLRKRMPDVDARRELEGKGDIAGLNQPDVRLRWLGQRMVKNYGCYSCHELKADGELDWQNEEGIGVELTGAQPWGIKHWDRLDFGHTSNDHVTHKGTTFKHQFTGEPVTAVVEINRRDWLEAKLRNPRVFDGGKMESKPWDELLRMPNFNLTPWEIERLQTFVLSFTDHEVAGLVELAKKRPSPDDKGKIRGDRIARDNNCAACHRFSLDAFEVKWARKENGKDRVSFELVEGRTEPRTPEQAANTLKEWGLIKDAKEAEAYTTLRVSGWAYHHRGLDEPKASGGAEFAVRDARGDWKLLVTTADGKKEIREVARYLPQEGGDILPYIRSFKTALEKDFQARKAGMEKKLEEEIAKETDAAKKKKMQDDFDDILDERLKKEGLAAANLIPNDPGQYEVRYPPMLRTQGVKTQAEWLFNFLKSPWQVRPNMAPLKPGAPAMADLNIRMPSFGFTDEEAAGLVKWFAVRDHLRGVDVYPHTPMPALDPARVPYVKQLFKDVVLNKEKGCTSCHWLQGQPPPGDPYKHAPDLGNVAERLRPRWLDVWVPEPKNVAPGAIMLPAGEVVPGYKEAPPEKKKDIIKGLVEALLNMSKVSSN